MWSGFIPISPPAGDINVSIAISTPSCGSTTSIDPALPTLLFIHRNWASAASFSNQFNDELLREKYNLVAYDRRTHSYTTGECQPGYSFYNAMEDLVYLMNALNIPTAHLIGDGEGAIVALETAIAEPSRVLSLTLIGIPKDVVLDEERETQEQIHLAVDNDFGLQEYKEYCHRAFNAVREVSYGKFKDSQDAVLTSRFHLERTWDQWKCSPQAIKNFTHAVTRLLLDRRAYSTEELSGIGCPVLLVHGKADYGASYKNSVEYQEAFRAAGVDANLELFEGAPRLVHFTHYQDFNWLLMHNISAATSSHLSSPRTPTTSFTPAQHTTPFDDLLFNIGSLTPADLQLIELHLKNGIKVTSRQRTSTGLKTPSLHDQISKSNEIVVSFVNGTEVAVDENGEITGPKVRVQVEAVSSTWI